MPRLPGRETTKPTIRIEHAEISYFTGDWDPLVYRRPCCIRGCEHRIGSSFEALRENKLKDLDSANDCGTSDNRVGRVVDKRDNERSPGYACNCCLDKILEGNYE